MRGIRAVKKWQHFLSIMAHGDDACMTDYSSPWAPGLLRGRVALVTGGGSGIGFTISEVLLRCGARVAIASRSAARLEASAMRLRAGTHGECLAVQCDVRDPESVETCVSHVIREFGALDVVVNCAAGNFLCPAAQLSPNAFRTVLEIDLTGTFLVCRAAYNAWMREHGGSIINISATLHYCGDPLQAHAGSAKAAIDALCKHLAREWGRDGVRVNNVAPGPITGTEGFRRLGGFLPESVLRRFVDRIPAGRLGEKREIGDAVTFLASDAARYITGHVLVVDGGAWLGGGTDVLLESFGSAGPASTAEARPRVGQTHARL